MFDFVAEQNLLLLENDLIRTRLWLSSDHDLFLPMMLLGATRGSCLPFWGDCVFWKFLMSNF
ncbi:TPA: hypothetical protein DEA21_02050 [Candidatus Uhrbacteria bacterium]|nr:hypothetical protein [Candidatus Uhrbacteria bacterium]HCU32019.1 hypothetical protein [Candidatus Uhrbacteria bacterium]